MTGALEAVIADRISRSGPLPFAAYMQLALYHPQHGYYSGSERTGWAGHFVTSAELDPAFGELWSRALAEIWDSCGRPTEFDLVEIGPGEAGMAASVLTAAEGAFADALRLRLIERSADAESRQRERLGGDPRVSWHRSPAETPRAEAGCVFANEVLDNLPVHLVEMHEGHLREVCVGLDGDRLTTTLLAPSNPELAAYIERCGVEVPEGHRFEVGLAAESLIAHASDRIGRGAVVFVDYGMTAAELANRPGGSLVCYSSSGIDDRPLENPGDKDITVHANWTSAAGALIRQGYEVAGPVPQRQVLKRLGLDALHGDLRAEFARASAAGEGAAAMRALSRRQALGALSDPAGLGSLEVLVGYRGIRRPGFIATEAGPRAGS